MKGTTTVKGHFTCYRDPNGMGDYDHVRRYVYDDVPFEDGSKRSVDYFVWVNKNGIESHDTTDLCLGVLADEGWVQIKKEEGVEVVQQARMEDLILG